MARGPGVVEWLIKDEAKPSAISDTTGPQPSAINHVEHDLPTLSGLKYMSRLIRSSCNAASSLWPFGPGRAGTV